MKIPIQVTVQIEIEAVDDNVVWTVDEEKMQDAIITELRRRESVINTFRVQSKNVQADRRIKDGEK